MLYFFSRKEVKKNGYAMDPLSPRKSRKGLLVGSSNPIYSLRRIFCHRVVWSALIKTIPCYAF